MIPWTSCLCFTSEREDDRWIMGTVAVLDVRNRRLLCPAGQLGVGVHVGASHRPTAGGRRPYLLRFGNRKRRHCAQESLETAQYSCSRSPRLATRSGIAASQVQPVNLRPELLEGAIDVIHRTAREPVGDGWPAGISRQKPAPWSRTPSTHPTRCPLFTTSAGCRPGDLWMQTFEEADSLMVWYTIGRGDTESELRRVLLPTGFRARDATATHVWGVRRDSLGVAYVTGRRAGSEDGIGVICRMWRTGALAWEPETGANEWANPLAGRLVLVSAAILTSATVLHFRHRPIGGEPELDYGPDDSRSSVRRTPEADGGFDRVRRVRVSREGHRVHVVEPLARRITVWSPGGQLLLRLEGEGQLRALGRPWDVRVLPDGLWAMYDRHFARVSDDGAVLEVLEAAMWGSGSGPGGPRHIWRYARLPSLTVMMGWTDRRAAAGASSGPALQRNRRGLDHRTLLRCWILGAGLWASVSTRAPRPIPTATYIAAQPFADADLSYFDGDRGRVGVVERRRRSWRGSW